MSLSGSITALATPFADGGGLDLDAWRRLLLQQLDGGTQGLVVAGSTGEAAALTDQEFDQLLQLAVETVGGRVPLLAGTGQMNTAKTIAQTRRAEAAGAQFALVVTPPYVRPTQAGLLAHYRAVADQGGLPVVLYNVPSRTGCDLLPETVAELAPHAQIVGIKEARPEPERMAALLSLRAPGFVVFSGDDPTACRSMLDGADGLISVGSNVLPRAFRRLCDLSRRGNRDQAAAWDLGLQDFYSFLGAEPNPIPVKALLKGMGYGVGLRLPLQELGAARRDEAARLVGAARLLEESTGRESLVA